MSCSGCHKKVALIVDDDKAFREVHGPRIIKKIFQETDITVKKAENVKSALRILFEMNRDHEEFVLAIFDMHMPTGKRSVKEITEEGVLLLNVLKDRFSFSSEGLVVVYTAYPSYQNCVKAIQAGAADYILKTAQTYMEPNGQSIEAPWGPEYLIERCKSILAAKPERIPPSKWVENNRAWTQEHFKGKWVAIVKAETGKRCGLQGTERDEMMIIDDDDYYHLLEGLLIHEDLVKERFTTWLMPHMSDVQDEEI